MELARIQEQESEQCKQPNKEKNRKITNFVLYPFDSDSNSCLYNKNNTSE